MNYKQTSAPAAEPILIDEAKAHLRVSGSDDDSYITSLIKAARHKAEEMTNRQLISATWKAYLDEFPKAGKEIELMHCPAADVTGITYVDSNGDTQTWDTAEWQKDVFSEPARIIPAYGCSWPSARKQLNSVAITFTAGYGASGSSVPEPIKQAMLLMIGHWYENREDVVIGRISTAVPMASKYLLETYKIISI